MKYFKSQRTVIILVILTVLAYIFLILAIARSNCSSLIALEKLEKRIETRLDDKKLTFINPFEGAAERKRYEKCIRGYFLLDEPEL